MALNKKVAIIQFLEKLRQIIKDDEIIWVDNKYEKEGVIIELIKTDSIENDNLKEKYNFTKSTIEKNKLINSIFNNKSYTIHNNNIKLIIDNKKNISEIILDDSNNLIAKSDIIDDITIATLNRKYDYNVSTDITPDVTYKINEEDFNHLKLFDIKEISTGKYNLIFPRNLIINKKIDNNNETYINFISDTEVSITNIFKKQFFIFKQINNLHYINY